MHYQSRHAQRGAALLVGVILTMVTAMVALSSMRGSQFQEGMTANLNHKAIAFTAAEAGAAYFHSWLSEHLKDNPWPSTAEEQAALEEKIKDIEEEEISYKNGIKVFYWFDPDDVSWNGDEMTITSIGQAGSETHPMAEAKISVTFTHQNESLLPIAPPAPLTFAGKVLSFDAADSNNFKITGKGTPAIATNKNFSDSDTTIKKAIKSQRYDNYTGNESDGTACTTPCVKSMDLGTPWGDANALKEFVNSLKDNPKVKYYNGNTEFSPSQEKLNNKTPITIVDGNVTFSGNPADYTGILIVLGGTVNVSGGGNFNINGSVYVANRVVNKNDGSWSFGDTDATVKGGGGMHITYNENPAGVGAGGAGESATILKWAEKI